MYFTRNTPGPSRVHFLDSPGPPTFDAEIVGLCDECKSSLETVSLEHWIDIDVMMIVTMTPITALETFITQIHPTREHLGSYQHGNLK